MHFEIEYEASPNSWKRWGELRAGGARGFRREARSKSLPSALLGCRAASPTRRRWRGYEADGSVGPRI